MCIGSIVLLLLAMVCGCGKNLSDKNFRYWIPSEPATLDPQIATGYTAQLLIDNLYEGLVRLDADGELSPGMAIKWDSSQNDTMFTFYLLHNSRWSDDATLVTADDFLFGIQRALAPDTNSSTCEPLYCIKNAKAVHEGRLPSMDLGVKALNPFTLEITLEEPMPNFPEITMLAPFMPCNRKLFESSGGKYGLETETTHSNGPFRMAKNNGWRHGTSIRIIKSVAYRGAQEVVPAQVMFLTGEDGKPPLNPIDDLMNYKFDALELSRETAAVATEKGMEVLNFEDTTWAMCFNTSLEPFGNTKIRQALTMAVNRADLLSALEKGHHSTDVLLPPITTFAGKPYDDWRSDILLPSQDAEQSKILLAEGLEEADFNSLPAISILVPDDLEHRKLGDTFLKYWQETLGFSMNLEPLSLEALQARITEGEYQVAICPLRAEKNGPGSFLSMFKSDSLHNPAFLYSSQYDALLDVSTGTPVSSEVSAYLQAEEYLLSTSVVYPLYNQGRFFGLAPTVSDIIFRPFKNSVDFIRAGKSKG